VAVARVLLLVVAPGVLPADLDERVLRAHHEQEDGPLGRRDGLGLDRAPHVERRDQGIFHSDRERRSRRPLGRDAVAVVLVVVRPSIAEGVERPMPSLWVAERVNRVVLDRRAQDGKNLILRYAPFVAAALQEVHDGGVCDVGGSVGAGMESDEPTARVPH
jgi:hypothetical protein